MTMDELAMKLDRIENLLESLVDAKPAREFYSTAEAAQILGRAEFTVREWCRQSRIYAEKREAGRGRYNEWMISQDEIRRIRDEGLLPS